jgi:acyl phosphate:glycerol-3-phosphate acyltransferase
MAIYLFLAAFAIGSIPTGLIIAKLNGVDIRKTGSGNTGATNVSRALGKKAGFVTLILDALKGSAVALIPQIIAVSNPKNAFQIACFLGLLAISGHCFSPFLRFKGGKGVATSLGVFLILAPIQTALSVFVFAITFYAKRYVSLSSITAATSLPILIWAAGRINGNQDRTLLGISTLVAILIAVRHEANIKRLIQGTENRL